MRYRITHRTEYAYAAAVTLCHNRMHLVPRDTPRQTCLSSQVDIDPQPSVVSERLDFFGNRMHLASIEQAHARLRIEVTSEVGIKTHADRPDPMPGEAWERVRERMTQDLRPDMLDARQYRLDSPMVRIEPPLFDYAAPSFTPARPLIEAVHELMRRIHEDFQYDPGFTVVSTPLDTVLEHRRGVCQDFAHLAVGCLRAMGLAARYVSGYLETEPPPGQERLDGADASHAWFAVYDPDQGWLDFDPTNNVVPMDRHITLAWGRDYSDVTPLRGVITGGGSHHELSVAVDVVRVD